MTLEAKAAVNAMVKVRLSDAAFAVLSLDDKRKRAELGIETDGSSLLGAADRMAALADTFEAVGSDYPPGERRAARAAGERIRRALFKSGV